MNGLVPVFQATGGVGGWALAIALLITTIKIFPKLKELQIGSDGSLRQDLMAEIVRLRADNTTEREQCDKRIEALQKVVSGLEAELRQLVSSNATAMSSRIEDHLKHVLPVGPPLPREIEEIVPKLYKIGDQDAGE